MPIPLAIPIAIAAFSAFSAGRQAQIGNAQKAEEARVAKLNAKTARIEGDLALKASRRIEKDSRRNTAQLIGTQRAAMSASGFAVGEGSFGDIIEESAVIGEMDAMVILFKGELAKLRKQKEAESLEAQARNLEASQTNPFLAAIGGGAGGFLSAGGGR